MCAFAKPPNQCRSQATKKRAFSQKPPKYRNNLRVRAPSRRCTFTAHADEAPGMQDDIEHSRNRWLDQEELRTKLTGFGTNRQGRAILRKYRDPLAKLLDADRRHPRNREIWRALKDADLVGEQAQTALFIDRLLTMGITAAAGYGIGVDDDGIKNF